MKTETASHGTPRILMTLFDDPPWLFLGFSMMFFSTGDAAACIFQIQTQPKIITKIPKKKKVGHAKEVNNLTRTPECAGIRRRPEVMISISVSTRSYEILSVIKETPSFSVAVIAIVTM